MGIDLIEVDRIGIKIRQEVGFRELVFSKNEINYCETKSKPFQYYAARFAAKEAFFKALGTGWLDGTAFNEVEVMHDDLGKPDLILLGKTKKNLIFLEKSKIFISITHLSSIAAAVVIIEN
ncbi:MAG: holo-ACP synthase [Chitinophagaceae bacterium]